MITFVILYALAGALVMRMLEWTEYKPQSLSERMEQIGRRRTCLMKAVKQIAVVSHNDIAFKHWNETVFDQCYNYEEPPFNETVTYSTWSVSRIPHEILYCLVARLQVATRRLPLLFHGYYDNRYMSSYTTYIIESLANAIILRLR